MPSCCPIPSAAVFRSNFPQQWRAAQGGFSLLEAVVALVLISTAGLALFSWINSNLISLQKVRDVNARTEATRNALEYMAAVNPMLTPRGSVNLGNVELAWDAKQLVQPKDGVDYPTGLSLWQFALFKTTVTLLEDGKKPWVSFQLEQVGYKRVRAIGVQ